MSDYSSRTPILVYSLISPTDETFCVEDGVLGVHRSLVLRGITDETLGVREGDIGGCCAGGRCEREQEEQRVW